LPPFEAKPFSGTAEELPAELSRELLPGEKVVWSGRPVKGLRLRASDILLVPFTLLWGGFAVFWEATVLTKGAPLFFALWGVPFVLIGVYITVGRFVFDAWQRSRIQYAVTDERVVIRTGGFRPEVVSLRLAYLPGLTFREGRGGFGTISFGGGSPFAGLMGGMAGWPGADRHLGPRFELVRNVRSVYDAIQGAQREAMRR
jgi:hypothetical protein